MGTLKVERRSGILGIPLGVSQHTLLGDLLREPCVGTVDTEITKTEPLLTVQETRGK